MIYAFPQKKKKKKKKKKKSGWTWKELVDLVVAFVGCNVVILIVLWVVLMYVSAVMYLPMLYYVCYIGLSDCFYVVYCKETFEIYNTIFL